MQQTSKQSKGRRTSSRCAREPAGSSHRLVRLINTSRGSCASYATPPAVRCEVIFGGQSWRAAKRREPTTNNTVRAPLKNLWCSLAPLIGFLSRHSASVPHTDNSQICQRSRTLDSLNSFAFAKYEELHCPLYPPLWSVLRLDPGRPSCRRDPVRGQPYARHGRANWF